MDIRASRNIASETRWSAVSFCWVLAMFVGVGTAAGLTGSAFAETAAPAVCAKTVSACGCVISASGVYTVGADLDSTQGLTTEGDCIEITVPNVILNLGSHNVTGPGGANSDFGIRIKSGSVNDTVVGSTVFAKVSGWHVGILSASNKGTFSNLDADSNDLAGIEFNHDASGNRLTDWSASHEGTFGVWIRRGNNNFVTSGKADSNRDGIFVGCGDASGFDCAGVPSSNGNDLVDNEVSSNTRYGLALDSNASETVVNATTASGNASDDLFDDSASCGTDTWLDDSFTTSNDTGCID